MSVDFTVPAADGELPPSWIHGTRRGQPAEPLLQVHWYDPHTVILRQSKSVTYEAPFLYLLLGNERALLVDTGATSDPGRFPLRETVDSLIREWTERWLSAEAAARYRLVVAHSHAHGDHVAGDPQLVGRPGTVVVGHSVREVTDFFGFADWPRDPRFLDLGGRVLDVLAIPGHHRAHLAFYDDCTGLLLTGDSVYPGRLYVRDPTQFAASLDRLVALTEGRAVRHVLGCHIEMSNRPGRDYPTGTTYQPDEAPLAMSLEQLAQVQAAAHRFIDQPGVHRFESFHLWVGPCRRAMLAQAGRLVWWRLRTLPILRRWRSMSATGE
ncbi:MBL fold metallo-hydrolase [Angustibacter sp. McL0619]|uniref:MBL fold metallo-hydrolase n=1 Tax=Angustibacter sp. McL0619 TaxID=3415676 RepID=UPI003CEE3B76